MDIKIQLDDQSAIDALNQLMQAGADMSPAMRAIAGVLKDETETAFEYEIDPATGIHWAGLFPETIKQREKKGKWPGQILQVTGGLAASVSTNYGFDFAQIGSNKKQALAQNYGAEVNNLIARPFIGVSEDGQQEMLMILSNFLQEAL